MFEPKFRLTDKIVSLIGAIERQYGQLQGEPLMPSLALALARENKILASHYSTSIEGNPLTQQEVTNILLDEKIPVNKSELEVKNYFKALNSISVMAHQKRIINLDLIKELHHLTMAGLDIKQPGQLRTSDVIVGHRTREKLVIKHNPPAHNQQDIARLLIQVIDWLNRPSTVYVLIKAGILHHQIAYIHPFFDGNGRVARLLTCYYLFLNNYEVTKYFILDDYYDMDRQLYSDKLHSADLPARPAGGPASMHGNNQATEWLEYFLEGISYSLIGALGRIKNLTSKRLSEIEGEKRVLVTRREEEVLQIVLEKKAVKMSDVQNQFSVTRQQAHALLQSLVEKGILSKYGKTKKSYYTLSEKS